MYDVMFGMPPVAKPNIKAMRTALDEIQRARFGSGNMDTSYTDALKADVIACQELPDMIDQMRVANHDLEERLEEMAYTSAASSTVAPTLGTRRKGR